MSCIWRWRTSITAELEPSHRRPTASVNGSIAPCRMSFTVSPFARKLYSSLEQLQNDLDSWLEEYNQRRPHSGKYCFGKTPLQTFLDSRQLADDKQLDRFPVVSSPDGHSRAARATSVA